jgi:hypothetical protein
VSNDGSCGCPGYEDCVPEHGTVTGDCPGWAIEPSGLCGNCDVARYAAIGRAAERLHELLTEQASK